MHTKKSDDRKIDAYNLTDVRVSYSLKNLLFKEITAYVLVRNVLDVEYESNAWVYRFNTAYDPTSYDMYANSEDGNTYNQIGAFNQAGINFFIGLKLRF